MKKRAYSIYLMTTENVGDEKVSPVDYFKFPMEVEKLCIHNCFDPSLKLDESFIIFGGGGLIHAATPDHRMKYLEDLCKLSPHMVTWGIGHNIHGSNKIEYPGYFVDSFLLHGIRDYKQEVLPHVPCVSCMDKAFSRKYKETRKYSAIGHNLDSYPSLDKLQKMEHKGAKFEDCVEFLAAGEFVVTNSYHGAYWGALLGKKVIVFDALSSKFFGMFENIVIAKPDTWEYSLAYAESDHILLRTCRKLNRQHHKKVVKLMEEYLENDI